MCEPSGNNTVFHGLTLAELEPVLVPCVLCIEISSDYN